MNEKTQSQLIPFVVIGTFVVLLLSIFSLGFNPLLIGGAVFAFLVGIYLIGNPERLFWWYLAWFYIVERISDYVSLANYGDEGFFALWIAVYAGLFILKKEFRSEPWFTKAIFALLSVCVVSWLLNRSNTLKFVLYISKTIVPMLVFWAALNFLDAEKAKKKLCRFFVVIFLVQVVLNVGWYFRINPLYNKYYGMLLHDLAQGTFNVVANESYFCLLLLLFIWPAILRVKKNVLRGWLICFAVLVFGHFVLTFSLHAYPILFVAFVVQLFVFYRGAQLFRILLPVALLGGIMVLIALALGVGESKGQDLSSLFSKENIQMRWDRFAVGPKLQFYNDAFLKAPAEKPLRWVVGAGPGDFASGTAVSHPPFSDVTLRYLGKYYLTYTGEQQRAGGSITQIVTTTYSILMADVGWFGLILHVGLYVVAAFKLIALERRGVFNDVISHVFVRGIVGFVVVFLLIGLLRGFHDVEVFTVSFWAISGILFAQARKAKLADQQCAVKDELMG
jgi:hypothetical protein